MSGVIATQRAASQLRYLKQTLERFEAFHSANSKALIREFCDFFTQDDVIGIVASAVFERIPVSPQDWHDQVQSSGTVHPLPADPLGAFAFRWGCLRLLRRGKIDLRYFVANHFKGSHLNEMLMNWKRLIIHPFADDCRTLADDLLKQLGDDEWIRFHEVVAAYLDGPFGKCGFGPRSWTDDDDDAAAEAETDSTPAPAAPAKVTKDLVGALDALEAAVRGVGAEGDLLKDVAALRLEGERRTRSASRIRARLASLSGEHADLAEACQDVERAIR